MFEDVEKFLQENRHGKHGGSGDSEFMPPNGGPISASGLKALLNKAFGDSITVEEIDESNGDRTLLKRKIQGVAVSIAEAATQMGLKPICTDSNGLKLKKGDRLKTPGGSYKTVLALGLRFVNLSHTEDPKKDDGVWFEHEIKQLKFVKE